MQENIKDPYHVGLLHTWFVMFGLIRGDQKSRIVMDAHGGMERWRRLAKRWTAAKSRRD